MLKIFQKNMGKIKPKAIRKNIQVITKNVTLNKKYDDKKHTKEKHHMKKKVEPLGVTT